MAAASLPSPMTMTVCFSDVSQNDDGDLIWRRAFSSQDGIMKFDAGAGTTAFLTNAPLGASSWTAVQINNAGTVGYRAGFTGGNAWTTFFRRRVFHTSGRDRHRRGAVTTNSCLPHRTTRMA